MRVFAFILFLTFSQIVSTQEKDSSDSKLKIDFWIKNYDQITKGPEYDLAHSVFNKIIAVADKPVGVLPSLHVFSNLKFNQLFATLDGAIVMPLEVIKFCQKEGRFGEARLAFLIGHEIKHIVRGDYELINTLIKFIEDVGSQEPTKDFSAIWDRVNWGPSLERRKAIEIQADEYGILYASLAGFDVGAIISSTNSFILDFYMFAGTDTYGGFSHPSANERIQAAQQRMVSILEFLDIFDCGVKLYTIGEYDEAIDLFTKFVTQYPSREVFNNRGICYYQKALSLFARWKPDELEENPNFVFKLSAQIDPVSRARVTTRAAQPRYERMILESIDKAIADFREAERLDTQYPIVYNNLGCVHLLKGELGFARDYLKKALQMDDLYKEAYNNLGICYTAEGNGEMAENSFLDACRISPVYSDPIYNLGQLYTLVGRLEKGKNYFERYLKLDEYSGYAEKARDFLKKPKSEPIPPDFIEVIDGITPQSISPYGNSWQRFQTTNAKLLVSHDDKQHIKYFYYRKNNTQKTICIVSTEKGYDGQTAKSIRIGDSEQVVKDKYPFRKKVIPAGTGVLWVYKDLKLVFEMRYGKVYGWYLFEIL